MNKINIVTYEKWSEASRYWEPKALVEYLLSHLSCKMEKNFQGCWKTFIKIFICSDWKIARLRNTISNKDTVSIKLSELIWLYSFQVDKFLQTRKKEIMISIPQFIITFDQNSHRSRSQFCSGKRFRWFCHSSCPLL